MGKNKTEPAKEYRAKCNRVTHREIICGVSCCIECEAACCRCESDSECSCCYSSSFDDEVEN